MLRRQARTDPTPAHLVDTTLSCKDHGRPQPDLLRQEVHLQLITGRRVPVMMVPFMRGDRIDGSLLSGKR